MGGGITLRVPLSAPEFMPEAVGLGFSKGGYFVFVFVWRVGT